ncbi:putative receptor-like protein kinase At5g39000 [Salvia hispanica]|uniref:putative receptor-like protein kinase At5g39000 n=1 Tax=Salvia hispanica TaxID=49212 RepID=UPI002009BEBB|nr:putative receptor-like protein kinase At5g39000 [Salvia hispanica]
MPPNIPKCFLITMNLCRFLVAVLVLCFLITITAGSNDPARITGDVSINCGSDGTYAARSGREWLGDVRARVSSGLQLSGSSTVSTVVHNWASADPTPHQTARLSKSKFSYSFQVNAGQKIIRLHFNPTTYRGFKGLKDLFTVEACSFTLLSNFSASITAGALGVNTFAKDFCLDIPENQQLQIVLSAESSPSLDTYAFINGIEIISVPTSLSYFRGGDVGLQMVGQKALVYVDSSIALEIVHRMSIKQDLVSSADGSRDMFAMWLTAPKQKPGNINNITWNQPVDVGFRYLVRLHFSDRRLNMAETIGLSFKVLINEIVVSTDSGIVEVRDGSIPWYEDHVVLLNGHKQEGKRNLVICLQSNQDFKDMLGPLKGFEILKLSNPDSSLAAPNPLPPAQDSPLLTFQTLFMIIGRRNATMTFAIAVISLVNIVVHLLQKSWGSWESSSSEEENKPSAGAERLLRRFSLAEIRLATRNFDNGLIIGRGGFGKVYRGHIDKGQKVVAVKKLKLNSRQGAHEFLTEIETLSEIRHINVVSLIGYCNEHREMILVYEHMACGSLADHLYILPKDNSNCFSFTWKQCLNICIGVARGLEYLHTGCGIIHRDLKGSNILLDENFVAKVSDFGLAKPEQRNKLQSHVSTKVKGAVGYVDPYYVTTSKLRRKSDTYSFGVVLLELLCGRRAVDSEVLMDEQILTKWARDKINKGEVDQIIASSLREEISPNSLKTFVAIAGRCLNDDPKNRPTMSEVVLQLEFALKHQESNQNLVLNEITSVSVDLHPSTSNDRIDVSRDAPPIITTTQRQNLTLPLGRQTSGNFGINREVTSGKKQWTRFSTVKLFRFRPWHAFRKRTKPSKKNELLFQEIAVGSLQYDFARIRAATNDFSFANKVGQGGFGSVYKGLLSNGQEIAVKRLSSSSNQGNNEFVNELLILVRLLHRNLVKLLGFCQEGNERLLIYEFVERLSLDLILFDPMKCSLLDWDRRYKIILGTAMGLHYLHEGSELRIIHRDLKANNVLLDKDLNPKVADFGIARVLEAGESSNTSRIVGTYGYMAPEYAMHGTCSVKSDVYSFGVLVLEILSGQRNKNFMNGEDLVNLTWKNWREGTAANMIDPIVRRGSTDSLDVMLRCMHVGLLCIQESPASRPTMGSVTQMLGAFTSTLPTPSEPVAHMVSEEYRPTNTNYRQAEPEASVCNMDMSETEFYPR